jgi:predicted alpha/beta hydrolase family esterase
MNNLGNRVVVFLSDDDPFINLENAKEYYSHLKNIEIKEFQNKGHFNTGA